MNQLIKTSVRKVGRPHWSGLAERAERIADGWHSFDRNENADRVYQNQLTDIFTQHVDHSLALRYLDYYPYYKKLSEFTGVATDNILITAGCDEAIRLAFEATLTPASRYLSITPTYRGAETNASDLNPLFFRCDESEDAIAAAVAERPDVVYICSPNNPSGKVYSIEFLRLQAQNNPNTLFFIDNTYSDFCQEDYTPLIEYSNILIGQSFSKSWGLAGQRMGLLLGHQSLIERITAIRPIMSVSSVTLQAVNYLIDHYHLVEDTIERLKSGGRLMHSHFKNADIQNSQSVNHIIFTPTDDFRQLLQQQRILAAELPDNRIRLTTMPRAEFNQICSNTYK